MKRLSIIGNASAGKSQAQNAVNEAQRKLWGWDCDFHLPASLDELTELCRKLDPTKTEAVIVIGGDGTVNQVVGALKGKDIPLLPFPAGTANDLARELGLTANWEQVQTLIDQKATSTIDIIEVNGHPFTTVAGIGVGARLTDEYNSRRSQSSIFRWLSRAMESQIYTALSAKTILLNRDNAHTVRIKSDHFNETLRSAAIFICNQNRLGGNITVAPIIQNNDRRFSVLIINSTRAIPMIAALTQLKSGKIPHDCISISTDAITLTDINARIMPVFGDGEILTEDTQLVFRLAPNALTVYRDSNRLRAREKTFA